MKSSIGKVYEKHHTASRRPGFALLGDVRGAFLKDAIGKGRRVLDVGCRDGALTKFFAEGNTLLGVDIDTEALVRARDTLGIETKYIDLNGEWLVEDGSFDAVVAAEILEHLYYPETVIGKISRALTHDGVFAGSVPNAFSLANRFRYALKRKKNTPLEDPTHINHFTVAELRNLLRARFLRVEITGYGRLGWLARLFPQTFAFGLLFVARGRINT